MHIFTHVHVHVYRCMQTWSTKICGKAGWNCNVLRWTLNADRVRRFCGLAGSEFQMGEAMPLKECWPTNFRLCRDFWKLLTFFFFFFYLSITHYLWLCQYLAQLAQTNINIQRHFTVKPLNEESNVCNYTVEVHCLRMMWLIRTLLVRRALLWYGPVKFISSTDVLCNVFLCRALSLRVWVMCVCLVFSHSIIYQDKFLCFYHCLLL